MKKIYILIFLAFLVGLALYFLNTPQERSGEKEEVKNEASETTIIAEGLDTPWSMVFLPNEDILVAERPGRVRIIRNGVLEEMPVATLPNVREIGEGGLLGMALHPSFSSNNFIYLYYTYSGSGNNTFNRVVRMEYLDGSLRNEETIVDRIPGASNHNGGRIKFGPDNFLYITTGDAQNPSEAQDTNSLAGKILRTTDSGSPAPGNPFGNLVYSYGHRNPQGITWDGSALWETEHGSSATDEVNKIGRGLNYGWPVIRGDGTRQGMEAPYINSGASITWAPGGAAIMGGSLFFGGLRGETLYELDLTQKTINEHFEGEFGRIREVVVGPDGMLYISTSNRDGRGIPAQDDDKIIRVNADKL